MVTLRDYQQEAVDFLQPRQRGFIQAPAGSGKTLIASHAAARRAKPGWLVVWLANTREQVEQGIAAIEKTEGPEGIEFEVCCVAAQPDVSDADLIIFDEAHHAPAETWYSLLRQVKPEAIVWGFSATPWADNNPERDETLEKEFQNFFVIERERVEGSGHLIKGKVYLHDLDLPGQWDEEIKTLVTAEVDKRIRRYPILRDVKRVLGLQSKLRSLAKRIEAQAGKLALSLAASGAMPEEEQTRLGILEWVKEAVDATTERDKLVRQEHTRRVQWQLSQEYLQKNELRNQTAIDLAKKEAEAGESVLVLVHSIEHGQMFADAVPEARLVHSKLGARIRRDAIEQFRSGQTPVLVATSLADEGLDVPRASRLVLVSGGRSAAKLEQRAGRVLRPFEGKNGGVIHDFLDRGILFAHQQAKARVRTYSSLGYDPETVEYHAEVAK